jgi:hypothetical protein
MESLTTGPVLENSQGQLRPFGHVRVLIPQERHQSGHSATSHSCHKRASAQILLVRIALPVRRPSFCRRRSYRQHGHPTVFERKRHDFPDTDESQPKLDIAAYWNPGCGTVSNPASSLCPRTNATNAFSMSSEGP